VISAMGMSLEKATRRPFGEVGGVDAGATSIWDGGDILSLDHIRYARRIP
jgi:hypothetical protein